MRVCVCVCENSDSYIYPYIYKDSVDKLFFHQAINWKLLSNVVCVFFLSYT